MTKAVPLWLKFQGDNSGDVDIAEECGVPVCGERLVVDLGSKPKLCVLNFVWVNNFDGKCWKVKEKSYMRVLMMLRGGTAPFQIETGRWRGVPQEDRENV